VRKNAWKGKCSHLADCKQPHVQRLGFLCYGEEKKGSQVIDSEYHRKKPSFSEPLTRKGRPTSSAPGSSSQEKGERGFCGNAKNLRLLKTRLPPCMLRKKREARALTAKIGIRTYRKGVLA